MGTVKLEPLGQRPLLSGQLRGRARFWRRRDLLGPKDALSPVANARNIPKVYGTINLLTRFLSERSNVLKAAKK